MNLIKLTLLVEAKYGPLEELSRATASTLIEKLNGKI
jgi:hypothetical protein